MRALLSNAWISLSTQERRYREWFSEHPLRAAVLTTLGILFVLIIAWLGVAAYATLSLRAAAEALSDMADPDEGFELSASMLVEAEREIRTVQRQSHRLDRLTSFPFADSAIGAVPYAGSRWTAGRQAIRLSAAMSDAGVTGMQVARDAYASFERSGIRYDPESSDSTWLQAVDYQRDRIPGIAADLRTALAIYADLDREKLPETIARRLEVLDRALPYADDALYVADHYEAFFHAAGGDGTIRYLLLFQNPAELRPAGGFPGTFGVFEFRYGQLVGYEMFDSHDITSDYMARRSEVLEQPWAFQAFAPQDGFILHDATWYADYPKSATLMLQMYAETSWPSVNGVIAVQPEAVSDMVHVTGPVEVLVDDELRTITEDNVYDEVERYRRLRFEGLREGELGDHKDILIDIGEAIMDAFTDSGGSDVVEAAYLLLDSADRRNLQIFIGQHEVQRFVDQQGWSGKLDPDPKAPTIAITFANMVLEKASMAIRPSYDLHLGRGADGELRGTLVMTLEHTGRHDQDHRYFGFQRWFIQVALPEGANLTGSNYDQAPDPEAPNGGAYVVDLFPEQTKEIWVSFRAPNAEVFVLRRQPGQVPPRVTVHVPGCEPVDGGYLMRDLTIEFDDDCANVNDPDPDEPQLLMLSERFDVLRARS